MTMTRWRILVQKKEPITTYFVPMVTAIIQLSLLFIWVFILYCFYTTYTVTYDTTTLQENLSHNPNAKQDIFCK